MVTGKVSGSSIVYQECREGTGGPSGGVFRPKGPHGLWEEANQLLVGWLKPHYRPMRLRWRYPKVEEVEKVSKVGEGILLLVGLE